MTKQPVAKRKPAAKSGGSALRWITHTVGGAVTSGGTIVALLIGMWAVDDRYAHAADITKQVEVNRLTAEKAILEIRKSSLEDKVYDTAARVAQSRKPLPPAEAAIFQRYQAELNSVAKAVEAKERSLERLKTGR